MLTISLGPGHGIDRSRIVAVLSARSRPVARLRRDAEADGRLLDAAGRNRVCSLVLTADNEVILSQSGPRTISRRIEKRRFSRTAPPHGVNDAGRLAACSKRSGEA